MIEGTFTELEDTKSKIPQRKDEFSFKLMKFAMSAKHLSEEI